MELFISFELDSRNEKHQISDKARVARSSIYPKLKDFLNGREYSNIINELSIIPVIYQKDLLEQSGERKYISKKEGFADFRISIDYDKFVHGTDKEREHLMLKNIIDSIKIIHGRLKNEFQGTKLENDILGLFNLTYNELNVNKTTSN